MSATMVSARPAFRPLAETVVPAAASLDASDWAELGSIVDEAVAARDASVRRQVGLLVGVLEWLPLLRWGRRFSGLDPHRRTRFLAALQDARLLLLRRGIWGLRTLVLMGYYGRAAAAAEIGYRPDMDGWEGRR